MDEFEDGSETVATQDWNIVAENRKKDGFREGVTVGREAKLQEGFNKGFEDGLNRSLSVGFMCGVLSGTLALSQSFGIPNLTDTDVHDIEGVLQQLQQVKDKNIEESGLSFNLNVNPTSPVDEGLKSEVTDPKSGWTVTGTSESQSSELRTDSESGGTVTGTSESQSSEFRTDSESGGTVKGILESQSHELRTDCKSGGTVTGTSESQSHELRTEMSTLSDGDVCQSQNREENARNEEDKSVSYQILQDYNRLLRDLNLDVCLQTSTTISKQYQKPL